MKSDMFIGSKFKKLLIKIMKKNKNTNRVLEFYFYSFFIVAIWPILSGMN